MTVDSKFTVSIELLRIVTPILVGICLFMLSSIWGSLKEIQAEQSNVRERIVMIETTLNLQRRK